MFPLIPASERNYLWTIVTWLFVALCFFAVIHLLSPMCNSTYTPGVPPAASAVPPQASAGGGIPDVVNEQAKATARAQAEEARARSRARLQSLQHECENVVALSKEFEREHAEWTMLAEALLTDERGKRLATNLESVDAFRALSQAARPPLAVAEQVRERIATLSGPLQSALKADDQAYMPSEDFVALLERERELITSATASYTHARNYVDGLLAATAQAHGSETLAAVIQQRAAREARTQAMATAAARGEAVVEVQQQLAVAEATKVREIGRTEADRIRSEEDAEQARIDAEAIRIRQQAARERQVKLANDPDIQARFAPFLTPGRRYPARYEGSVRWLERKPWGRTAPRPVSLRELKTGGVLDNFESFVIAATSSKSKTGSQNDRPHWPMPATAAEWEARRADFKLFQELIPVWVELSSIPSE